MVERSFRVPLTPSGGQQVDIMTQEGADAFLLRLGRASSKTPGYIAASLEKGNSMRAKLDKNKFSGRKKFQAEQQLDMMYMSFLCVADNSSLRVFESALKPASASSPNQLLMYWKHAESIFKTLCEDTQWKTTGKIKKYDKYLLDSLVVHCKHQNACRQLLDKTTLLKTLATFLGNCNNPSGEICEEFLCMVSNLKNVMRMEFEQSFDEIFKLYAKTGVLGQALRCFAYPSPNGRPRFLDHCSYFLDDLMRSSATVRKNLESGTPAGNILAALVARTDIQKSIHNRFLNLSRLSSYTAKWASGQYGKICRHCSKTDSSDAFQNSLKVCQRCEAVYYCSRECQKADWKTHKKDCKPVDKQFNQSMKGSEEGSMLFLMGNYFSIMAGIANTTKQNNYARKDVMLVLDFLADENGVAPALKSPPEFSFVSISDALNGNWEPDWFHKGYDDRYSEHAKNWRGGVKQHSEQASDNHLMMTLRWSSGNPSVSKVQLQSPDTGTQMFSPDAVRAFSMALDGDYSGLSSHFDGVVYEFLRRRFCGDTSPLNGMLAGLGAMGFQSLN